MPVLFVLGATSDIAGATALRFARDGWDCILAGRRTDDLEPIAKDIEHRTERKTYCVTVDVTAISDSERQTIWKELPMRPSALLCAVGCLGDQKAALTDAEHSRKIIATNFTSLVPWLEMAAEEMQSGDGGTIIGISSVAGDRGRQSNYIYGSAKAAYSAYLSGLRNRMFKTGVHVLTVKPGFVNTAMTADIKLSPLLTAEPEQVAEDIWWAVRKKKDILYTRWFWRYIMTIVCAIPENFFKRLSL